MVGTMAINSSKENAGNVLDEPKEAKSTDKALCCDIGVLKDIYRYETRQLERRDYSLILMLLEICGANDKELPKEMLPNAKEALHDCCMQTLRKGDVFSGYSETQILVMLVVSNVMDAAKVTNRLRERFNSGNIGMEVYLKAEIQTSLQV